uniref:Ubiquitin-like protease family profile domain-containing protein n=1 Tax=Leersia perrieri TaxID=77586 RepID=A0A0D9VXA0_9ORYZ
MLRHKREGVYDVGFIDPYVVYSTNVKDKAEETERNFLRFLWKQAHKKRIIFPYVFSAWVRFTSKEPGEWKVPLRQKEGTNLCAFYVAESIMSRGQRRLSDLSDLEYRRDQVAKEDQHKAIQEALAGFLNDEVLDRKGEHYYDGRLGPTSVDCNIDLDDPNFY